MGVNVNGRWALEVEAPLGIVSSERGAFGRNRIGNEGASIGRRPTHNEGYHTSCILPCLIVKITIHVIRSSKKRNFE